MSKAQKQAPVDRAELFALANVVAQRVQIKQVRLLETKAHNLSSPDHQLGDTVQVRYGTTARLTGDKKTLVVVFTGNAEIKAEKESEDFHVEASFALAYQIESNDGLTKAHINAFGELNGLFNVWPYFRELVQSISARMCLPPITLPVQQPVKRNTEARRSKAKASKAD